MSEFHFQSLIELCLATHDRLQLQAARSVDVALVVRNWLFGWYIVEFEDGGADYAELYGKKLISRLAAELKAHSVKGTSATNLRKFREFYQVYGRVDQIQQTLFVDSGKVGGQESQQTVSVTSFYERVNHPDVVRQLIEKLATNFHMGWSHYVVLLTLDNHDERRFYEIEAAANSWSVRELERQIDSSLYERLALSRDKEEIRRLAEQGLVIEKAADLMKSICSVMTVIAVQILNSLLFFFLSFSSEKPIE